MKLPRLAVIMTVGSWSLTGVLTALQGSASSISQENYGIGGNKALGLSIQELLSSLLQNTLAQTLRTNTARRLCFINTL